MIGIDNESEGLKERIRNLFSDDFCNEDHDRYEACLTCEHESRKIIQAQQAQEAKLIAIVEKLREAVESLEMIRTPYLVNGCVYSFRCYDMAETYDKLQAAKQALNML